jgi:hypothetical protein
MSVRNEGFLTENKVLSSTIASSVSSYVDVRDSG